MVFRRPHLNLGYTPDDPEGVDGLPELIEFNAKHNPDGVFCLQTRAGEGSTPCQITFRELQSAVERCSAWLVASGSTEGRKEGEKYPAPVGILLGSDITIYIYIAALLRLGTPVLCLSARLTPVAIAHLLKATSAATILVNNQVARLSKETSELLSEDPEYVAAEKKVAFVEALGYEDFLNHEHPDLLHLTQIPPAYIHKERHELGAVIMHSSGTTGLPKPIYHAPSYLLVYAACHNMPEQEEPFAFNVSTLPLYHGFGLLAPSLALSIGMPCVLPPASTIPTARSTLAALSSVKARYMMSVPSILEDMLIMKELNSLPVLQTLDFIAIGGAPMKEHIGAELVANGVNLLNHWGATEIGAIALIQPVPADYDWHYLLPRTDIGLEFELIDAPTRSYRLIGHPQGWSGPFYVQDSLEMHPTAKTVQVRIRGRTDDLIVLATGEKLRPTTLEKAASEFPAVKDALAFGDGRASLGLLVEVTEANEKEYPPTEEGKAKFLEAFQPYVERGNESTDSHGKISMDMIILTYSSVKPLLRTDKGSLARKANYAAFEEEIRVCYEKAELATSNADPLPVPKDQEGEQDLRKTLREFILSATHNKADFLSLPDGDQTDFFEVGLDSLQATRLRAAIQNALKATSLDIDDVAKQLPLDFVFQNSSVDKLVSALTNIMLGHDAPGNESQPVDRESRRVKAMLEMVDRYVDEIKAFGDSLPSSAECSHAPLVNGHSKISPENVVLLTGSTGSLGCMLLSRFVADSTISKVYCLNRPRDGCARQYQLTMMQKRGVVVEDSDKAWQKVVFLNSTTSQANLGLDAEQYEELQSVTHIIHNAWPVDFNRNLSSLETQVKVLSNLVRLALRGASKSRCCPAYPSQVPPKRILFASSIAVVGRYPIVNPSGPGDVPEVELDPRCTDDFGYPEAKWVCEEILLKANELFKQTASDSEPSSSSALLRASSVRIGQMTGPEGSGAWNETEHFPIIVRTSKMVKALPQVEGSLSWMPVNRAAAVVSELLFSTGFQPIYHMENPSRQSWQGILDSLSTILGSPEDGPLPTIPFTKWLARVKAFGEDQEQNKALKVMHFLEHDFIRMASGDVILRTANAKLDSPTMVKSTSLDKKHLEEYCDYWRRQGFLL
ncbi:hypothetical protein D9613_000452 [Agrocybe pediades]|uniref:Carrier domain-containing protein n=1 Tax=Agrocybe pediades TaxID=84607 RepID=A0A8H4R236_9AGAR|nr:hypothetical protein D9613_000452 [Agrocybe pediades]